MNFTVKRIKNSLKKSNSVMFIYSKYKSFRNRVLLPMNYLSDYQLYRKYSLVFKARSFAKLESDLIL